jgi:hypothetical protein
MEVFDAKLCPMGVTLRKSVARAEALRVHRLSTVAVMSDSQAAIRWTAHLDRGQWQQLARAINEHARALCAHSIAVAIHCVLEHSGIPLNREADRLANKAREDQGYTVRELTYTLAANRVRRSSEGRMVANAPSEADRCSKHYGYGLKGKAARK